MIDPKKIEEAVSRHLAGGLYLAASAEQQRSAAAMAERDIAAVTGRQLESDDPLCIDAVAEQAIFLLLNVDKLHTPQREVVSESVEGAGSVTYRSGAAPARLISPRALELCSLLRSRTLELRRG